MRDTPERISRVVYHDDDEEYGPTIDYEDGEAESDPSGGWTATVYVRADLYDELRRVLNNRAGMEAKAD